MPIYEYQCECGATLETLEKVGAPRDRCGELCAEKACKKAKLSPGKGAVERKFSPGMIRGDGKEAREVVIDPCKRSNRPGGGCEDHEW